MSEFPLARILDFMRKVDPFGTLEPAELERVIAHMDIAYFPPSEEIIKTGGEPAQSLYVIFSGSVKITVQDDSGAEILVDVRGEGDTFGSVSLLQGKQALFSVTTREDLLAFLLPGEEFRELVESHDRFRQHFSATFARNIQAARHTGNGGGEQLRSVPAFPDLAAHMRSRVADIMSPKVLTCPAGNTIRQAAQSMTQRGVGSIVVADEQDQPLGLITDTDLRSRVLASGLSPETPVREVMSQPLMDISPQAYAFEAVLELTRHGVHHLVVNEAGRMVGVLSDHDIKMITGSSPVDVARKIEKVTSLEELALHTRRVHQVLEMLLRLGGSLSYLLDLSSEITDRISLKVMELVQTEMVMELGAAPGTFAWLALGAAGRGELAPPVDLDFALIHTDLPQPRARQMASWCGRFAPRLSEGLAQCGLPPKKNGLSAMGPAGCLSLEGWRDTYLKWIKEPTPNLLNQVNGYFDFRPVLGEGGFSHTLRKDILKAVAENRPFLKLLARLSLDRRPPLSFLRNQVVEADGSYSELLDLKDKVLRPAVDAVRVLALDLGLEQVGTLERLTALSKQGIINQQLEAELQEALGFIINLRVSFYLAAMNQDQPYSDMVKPESLDSWQRRMLKESFAVISRLQGRLRARHLIQNAA